MDLVDFLRSRRDQGGFSTEDLVTSFVPLAKQVLSLHQQGQVAPFGELSAFRVEANVLQLATDAGVAPHPLNETTRRFQDYFSSSVDVRSESKASRDVDQHQRVFRSLDVADESDAIERPIYRTHYQAWESAVGTHDPAADVFCLGLILADMACGVDLTDTSELEHWVRSRSNLFELNRDLHPVVAQAIYRMTELDRTRRSQDLAAVIYSLENYRDQPVDIEFDLSSIPGFKQQDASSRQTLILGRLRERLFDLTRRNRLLNFQPSLQTVNLTQASVPLSFDIREIRPDQIMVWSKTLAQQIAAGHSIPLNQHLNFSEAIYLPAQLDRLIADSRRDLAEYGFVQLRLVACFLRWADLKESPPEFYTSPFVLIPVQLRKKKGIRDSYWLEPLSELAEVNPVIRHQFQQLYGIELPDHINLSEGDLETLYDALNQQIQANAPGVDLAYIDRPQVDLVHETAKRRLDQYRRRARRYGKGRRTFGDLEYSYDPANMEPLGIRLYQEFLQARTTRLDDIIDDQPRARNLAAPHDADAETDRAETKKSATEKTRSFAHVGTEDHSNPYRWQFDLCNLTLGNFKYRKMSLVRDYDALLKGIPENPVFRSIFDEQAPLKDSPPQTPEITDRADVLPCDPTQSTAIARAREGQSYIIQGPPGTGKSQTIANLIADFVHRGKRVLFVCEKRAAIDVVYARLRQVGLGDLACLIHDTQADKKEFVHNLRHGFESLVEAAPTKAQPRIVPSAISLKEEVKPLADFNEFMLSFPPESGVEVRELLNRLLALDKMPQEASTVAMDAAAMERLPSYSTWDRCRTPLDRLQKWLEYGNAGQPLANHPFRWLSPDILHWDHPINEVGDRAAKALKHLERLEQQLAEVGYEAKHGSNLESLLPWVRWSALATPLARAGKLALIDVDSPLSKQWSSEEKKIADAEEQLARHREANRNWLDKLSPDDTRLILEQARTIEPAWYRWLMPKWWRIRGELNRRYRFDDHPIRPTFVQVLSQLAEEHLAQDECDNVRDSIVEQLGWGVDFPTAQQTLAQLRETWLDPSEGIRQEIELCLDDPRGSERVQAWGAILTTLERLIDDTGDWMEPWRHEDLTKWSQELRRLSLELANLPDYLEALRIVGDLPLDVRSALRDHALTLHEFELVIAGNSIEGILQKRRSQGTFNGQRRNLIQASLEKHYGSWLKENASQIHHQVASRLESEIQLAETPKREVEGEQRDRRNTLNAGLKELQREFKKSMRYRSIRDLVADESGEVVKIMKPVWLMSPLSVSDALPLDPSHFDVVLFDEASQITLEEAVPSLFRAKQAIVVGDEKQMPPTQFFRSQSSDEVDDDEGDVESLGLEESSFLSHCTQMLPNTLLGWHYRSRSESLISFSNWSFYDGRLLTAPEERLSTPDQRPLEAESAEDAREAVEPALTRPISFHHLGYGTYENRRNADEAEYIAELVRGIFEQESNPTIGIVAFSEAQQDEIESALNRLGRQDSSFQEQLDLELDREDDGQFNGLLVKNLENIQGDERDIVILSVCYGPDSAGKIRMNFGPINQGGGEKRLNVAFSRAKHHMMVVSSMKGERITNEHNPGALAFKNYLRFAEAISRGDNQLAQHILAATGTNEFASQLRDPWQANLVDSLAKWLESEGFVVDRNLGQSMFKVDLAIRSEHDSIYRLGLLVDGRAYYEQGDLLERDMMRPKLLRDFGWRVAIVLGIDWYQDGPAVKAKILDLLGSPHPDEPDDQR